MKDNTPTLDAEIVDLIEQHRKLIYKVVSSYCHDINEQEDLIQEIIFQIVKGYENFDHKVKVTTWMYKIAFNVSISHYRKVKNRKKFITLMPDKIVTVDEISDEWIDDNIKRLRYFIDQLNALNKAILIMYLDGNSHVEISEAMGISVSNVGTRINRIKNQLKKKFNR